MEWISIKDKLPEVRQLTSGIITSDRLLIFVDGDISVGYYNGSYWNDEGNDWNYVKVTHWMPLPEPPEEKINDEMD